MCMLLCSPRAVPRMGQRMRAVIADGVTAPPSPHSSMVVSITPLCALLINPGENRLLVLTPAICTSHPSRYSISRVTITKS